MANIPQQCVDLFNMNCAVGTDIGLKQFFFEAACEFSGVAEYKSIETLVRGNHRAAYCTIDLLHLLVVQEDFTHTLRRFTGHPGKHSQTIALDNTASSENTGSGKMHHRKELD